MKKAPTKAEQNAPKVVVVPKPEPVEEVKETEMEMEVI